ncbi:class A sortase [Paucilactobacillus suebicus]|nr:class A sortase [Paucilactobacillus suebicus]
MNNKKRGKLRRWLGTTFFTILILISLGLIFNEQIKSWMISRYQPQVTRQTIKKSNSKKGNYNFSKVKSLDLQTVASAQMNKQKINVIGEISIPAIKMNLPIAKGVSNVTLALAAGTMRADMKMGKGNYALAGHNMHTKNILFTPLYRKSAVGQKIYITDLNHVYQYRIYKRTFIKATRLDVVKNTPHRNIVTLITCDAQGKNRLMVRGRLQKTMKFKDAPKQVQKQLSAKFTNTSD